ncbi:MAG: sigma 54-interacting transcriptional regulator [Isosphaeraceae bacterium]|nr:sigma 54-interacting transcriptional regulator [Isosphaeraceae bacterium]
MDKESDATTEGAAVRPVTSAPGPQNDDEFSALRAIVAGTARGTGEAFFQSLVGHLADAVDVGYAFVAEFAGARTRVRTLAHWGKGAALPGVEYDLEGTPCEDVLRGSLCHHPNAVRAKFPHDRYLVEFGIESYLGVPLLDAAGEVLGHLAVCDDRPMAARPRLLFVFRIFAARAAAELERLRVERLRAESERRYRELYEEAPNVYVSLGRDFRLLSVNRRTAQVLGREAAALVGAPVLDLFAESPAGRVRAETAFGRCFQGEDLAGLELELRRPDGSPLWVSVWMRPTRDAGGTIQAAHSIWVDVTDRVLAEMERARLQQQNLYLQEEIKSVHNFEEIVGRSPALQGVFDKVARVAPTDATVLITGETGTGKELIARAIHSRSRRAGKPLIKVNCAALPAGLVESELFGHEKGAFTGAFSRRLGRFELAEGGTLFLDEIGDLPLEAQAKLLRVLQEHEFDRVGGVSPVKADIRIIAATNRDLLQAVRAKAFREDLYYRLCVIPIALPPLRERTEDIALLVRVFVARFAAKLGKRIEGTGPETLRRLVAYSWPGNIRELENVLERAVILATSATLEIDPDVPGHAATGLPNASPLALEAVEKNHILAVLSQTGWVIEGPRGAAVRLGLHPNTLRSRLKKLGLARPTHENS